MNCLDVCVCGRYGKCLIAAFLRNLHRIQIDTMNPLRKRTLCYVQQSGSLTEERSFIFWLKGLKLATQLGNLLGHSSIFIRKRIFQNIFVIKPYQREKIFGIFYLHNLVNNEPFVRV